MTTINVQFSDATEATIVSYFRSAQNTDDFPNQGTVSDDDQRYGKFLTGVPNGSDMPNYTGPDLTAPPTDYVTVNATQQVALMTTASAVTFGMADAYVAGLLDDADTTKFKAWAAYKLALSKVDLTQAQPVWPTPPALAST